MRNGVHINAFKDTRSLPARLCGPLGLHPRSDLSTHLISKRVSLDFERVALLAQLVELG